MIGEVTRISPSTAWEFLEFRHYAGRKPQISRAYGWYINNQLVAVCTFGKPVSSHLCDCVCGKEYSGSVYELNRLCRVDTLKEPISQFVSACIRDIKKVNWIIVSYSDTGMHHNGYIYQATNFLFTGTTNPRTDKYVDGGKHPRHYEDSTSEWRTIRTAKNRYIYFATNNKRLRKEWMRLLKYPVLPYPKAENKNYVLGEIQKQVFINKDGETTTSVQSDANTPKKESLW